jgi:hypothetical protein
MPGVIEIICISPVAAVNKDDCGMRAGTGGQPQIAELQGVGAIGNARIRFGRLQSENVLTHGGGGGSGGEESSSSHD